ncbi:MAG: hypothetical protein R3F49_00255 [Planctomycetota bacterium]
MSDASPSATSALPRGRRAPRAAGWLPHALLVGAALVMAAIARARHLSDEAAWQIATDTTRPARERIDAIHRLANRAEASDPRLGGALVQRLLTGDDLLLREYALAIDLCKHQQHIAAGEPALQAAYALAHPGPIASAHHVRSLLVYRRKVGGPPVGGLGRLTWTEVGWFLAANAGQPLPTPETLAEHLRGRWEGAEPRVRTSR